MESGDWAMIEIDINEYCESGKCYYVHAVGDMKRVLAKFVDFEAHGARMDDYVVVEILQAKSGYSIRSGASYEEMVQDRRAEIALEKDKRMKKIEKEGKKRRLEQYKSLREEFGDI
jgi:hypothetical protein